MTANRVTLGEGELFELNSRLERVGEIADRLAIAATDPMPRPGGKGPQRRSQPASRPPYNIAAQGLLGELVDAVRETVHAICKHRNEGVDDMGLEAAALWLRKHLTALSAMEARGVVLADRLTRVLDRSARATGLVADEYTINASMVEAANRQLVTANQVVKLAYKLGDQAKGLNYERIRTLKRRGELAVAAEDADTGTKFYRLGDVLAAHKRFRSRRRAS